MKERNPLNGAFELTARCNLSCQMCLVRIDQDTIKRLGKREKTADEWIRMAHEIHEAGTLKLLLTGGEPMMHPEFQKIYEAIAQMGFLLTIYTNAVMLTDEIMEVMRRWPPHSIGVTMYGASNETYAKVTGRADGYDRFLTGVEKLAQLPSLFDIRTTITKDNRQDLEQMKQFVQERFGEEQQLHVSRVVIRQVREGVSDPVSCRLSPEENAELCYGSMWDYLEEQEQKGTPVELHVPMGNDTSGITGQGCQDLFGPCDAGITSFLITWDGKMYPCQLADKGCTDPFAEGFTEAFRRLPEQYPAAKTIEKCRGCKYQRICETCPATRLAETGDWFGIPEYFCKEAEYTWNKMEHYKVF